MKPEKRDMTFDRGSAVGTALFMRKNAEPQRHLALSFPTEITAYAGVTACRNSMVLAVLLPW